ncbi:5-bromo-4-chloroindolyl phosphate hydrolysis family protein [Cronobacter muytjensii]|nr:5-bromo-4-chloroindolyl phosphate hydrolysis family protein [Cronobacter muytjensii]
MATFLETLHNKRWKRVLIQLCIMLFSVSFDNALLQDTLAHTHTSPDALRGPLAVSCWVGFILLARALFYDRVAFTVGILAGLFWPGANAGFAFWAGGVALVTYILRNLKPFLKIYIWYLILGWLACLAYLDAFGTQSLSAGYVSFAGILIAIGSGWTPLSIALRRLLTTLKNKRLGKKAKPVAEPLPAGQETTTDFDAEREVRYLTSLQGLAPALQTEIDGIINYTNLIMVCIKTDPKDVEPGTKFLQRYLPAVRDITTRSHRLVEQQAENSSVDEINARSAAMLKTLHSAFSQQHARLLENDKTELAIEMSTLDKMLKTDGYV